MFVTAKNELLYHHHLPNAFPALRVTSKVKRNGWAKKSVSSYARLLARVLSFFSALTFFHHKSSVFSGGTGRSLAYLTLVWKVCLQNMVSVCPAMQNEPKRPYVLQATWWFCHRNRRGANYSIREMLRDESNTKYSIHLIFLMNRQITLITLVILFIY